MQQAPVTGHDESVEPERPRPGTRLFHWWWVIAAGYRVPRIRVKFDRNWSWILAPVTRSSVSSLSRSEP